MRYDILRGVRVVELGSAWAGPFAARLLADLGAEVIKVEAPRRPDMVRFSVYLDDDAGEPAWERGAHYQKFSRNKKSCIIDVQSARGRELFLRLLAKSDIFLENNTPRVREQLGLTDDVLREVAPNLVCISMPGFGLTGPYRDYLAYGLTVEGFSGLSSVTGYGDGSPPTRSAVPYGDPVAGVYGAIAGVVALLGKRRHGVVSHLELSQHEALITMLPDLLLRAQTEGNDPQPQDNRDGIVYDPQGVFACAGEDEWIAISVSNGKERDALLRLLGLSARADASDLDLHRALEGWARQRRRDEAVDILQGAGIPAGPVLSPREMTEHEQVEARQVYEDVAHPLYRTLPYSRIPIRISGAAEQADSHAPLFGEHNDEVFSGLLGLSHDEIQQLYDQGVTADAPDLT
ncbi:MAG: CoA transferase [Dehalococcoidia bacterium]|nr:CoA transferase [Dehalococcoidia bacterium]